MKKIFVIMACMMMVVVNLISQVAQNNHPYRKTYDLLNTHWVSKIENCCSNYYDFKEHGSYIFYSGERDEYCPGIYSIKKDTLFLHEFYSDEDDPFEILDREAKFVALINENSFQLLYREDLIRTKKGEIKWLRTKLDKPTFRKTNGSVPHVVSPK